MEMIYDLVTNGLARFNLPLELIFQCIGLCQIILVLWFFMHHVHVHKNNVVDIDLWWFRYIIKKYVFSWFSKTLFFVACALAEVIPSSKKNCVFLVMNFVLILFVTNCVFLLKSLSASTYFGWLCMYVGRNQLAEVNFPARIPCCQIATGKLSHTWFSALGMPWERSGNSKSKNFHRWAIFPGKISFPLPK